MNILKQNYGTSAEYDLNKDINLAILPVPCVQDALLSVESALAERNIQTITTAIRTLAGLLRIQGCDDSVIEESLRALWNTSPDLCIAAVRNACLQKAEPDMRVLSTQKSAILPQGTHFIDVCSDKGVTDKSIVVRKNGRGSLLRTNGEALHCRVIAGPDQSVEVQSEYARLVIFSVLNAPALSQVQMQTGDPAFARYLQGDADTFMAGRYFPAEMLGDPSWHALKMTPLCTQKGWEHIHPHTRLISVAEGSGMLETGTSADCADQQFSLNPGKIVVLSPGTWHRFSAGSNGLTVQPVHPVTPTSGASANSHEMFFGTWKTTFEMLQSVKRGALL